MCGDCAVMRTKCVQENMIFSGKTQDVYGKSMFWKKLSKNHKNFYWMSSCNITNSFIGILISRTLERLHWSLTTWKAQTTVVFGVAALPLRTHFQLLFFHASLVVVEVLEVPHGRPAIVAQVFLVLGMQKLERLGRIAADAVEVHAQVGHAPFSQLVGVVKLKSNF